MALFALPVDRTPRNFNNWHEPSVDTGWKADGSHSLRLQKQSLELALEREMK